MADRSAPYQEVIVESYRPASTAGLHGAVHVRPVAGQGFPPGLHVECSRAIVRNYPVGTRFRIRAKLTDRLGQGQYLYSHYNWAYEVIDPA